LEITAYDLQINTDGNEAMKIASNGSSTFNGSVYLKDTPNGGSQFGNIVVNDSDGRLYKVTPPSTYTAEEVDKKLAIKDKLIEKLSARLDELEKRIK